MSTQYYAPQQTPPPPPPAPRSRPAKWVPQTGIRNVVAIDKLPGRLVPSKFDDSSEVVFEVDGGHPWYVPQAVANVIYSLQLRPCQQIEVTVTGKKRTDLLILPLQPLAPAGPAAQAAPAGAGRNNGYHTPVPQMPPDPPSTPPPPPVRPPEPSPAPDGKEFSPVSLRFMAAYKAATDILIEEKAYALSRGLALDIRCEDVRCLAATIMIDQQKGGR